MKQIAVAIAASLCVVELSAAPGQPQKNQAWPCSPSAATMKATALRLRPTNPDTNRFIIMLDRALGFDTGYLTGPTSLRMPTEDGLSIWIKFPYPEYRFALMEAIRKREPIADVPASSSVVIDVWPSTIDAPDIAKVIVERDGKPIAPLANRLVLTPMRTALGRETVIHSGELAYSCATFAPTAAVRVTAIPQVGSNIQLDIAPETLRKFWTTAAK